MFFKGQCAAKQPLTKNKQFQVSNGVQSKDINNNNMCNFIILLFISRTSNVKMNFLQQWKFDVMSIE